MPPKPRLPWATGRIRVRAHRPTHQEGSWRSGTTRSSSAAATTASRAPPTWRRPARRSWCWSGATSSAAPPSPRRSSRGSGSACSYVVSLLRPEIIRELELPEARPGDPAARRHDHAARRRLPVARERPRHDRCRELRRWSTQRRRGLRGVRPADGRHGPVHQADPVDRAARPGPVRPDGVAAARRPGEGASATCRAPADDVHPADDDERGRLPGPVVRDRAAEGDDERVAASSARSRARARRAPRTCCCTTTWARSTARSARGASRRAAPAACRNAIAIAALSLGVEIRTEAPVARIEVTRRPRHRRHPGERRGDRGRRRPVERSTRTARSSSCSSPGTLDPEFEAEVRRYKYRGSSGKVNLALDGLPELTCMPGVGRVAARRDQLQPEPRLHGARLRRRQVRAVQPAPVHRHDHPDARRPLDGAARQARHELLRAVRAVQPGARRGMGRRRTRSVRRERDRHARGAIPRTSATSSCTSSASRRWTSRTSPA